MLLRLDQFACLEFIVPQYCGSLTNLNCLCSSVQLSTALQPCVLAACNVTESLQLELYQAVTCGAPNDKSRQKLQLYTFSALLTIASVFVVARFFVRIKLHVGLGADDWMMLVALAAYYVDVTAALVMYMQGFGQHMLWLSQEEITQSLMVSTLIVPHVHADF